MPADTLLMATDDGKRGKGAKTRNRPDLVIDFATLTGFGVAWGLTLLAQWLAQE